MTKELYFSFMENNLQENCDKKPLSQPKPLPINSSQLQLERQLREHVQRIIESLLFASPDPISLQKIREVTDVVHPFKPKELREMIQELSHSYLEHKRAFKLEEIADGYALRTHEEYAPYIEQFYRHKRGEKISHASTEVLAIIAYRQPITRPQIDAIRGVDSSGVIHQLLDRALIEVQGKLEAPGRPSLYGTTKQFLKHYGLKDLSHLQNFAHPL